MKSNIPFLKSWTQWYVLVVAVLVALVVFFAWFTEYFSS